MIESSPFGWFIKEWKEYLHFHGHTVLSCSEGIDVLRSVNNKTGRYRWILKCVREDSLRISKADRKAWRRLRDRQKAGVWQKIHEILLGKLRNCDQIDFGRCAVDSVTIRAVGEAKKLVLAL